MKKCQNVWPENQFSAFNSSFFDQLFFSFWLLDLFEKRKQIVNELVELRDAVSPFIDLFEREDVKKLLETDRDHTIILDHLRTNYSEVSLSLKSQCYDSW